MAQRAAVIGVATLIVGLIVGIAIGYFVIAPPAAVTTVTTSVPVTITVSPTVTPTPTPTITTPVPRPTEPYVPKDKISTLMEAIKTYVKEKGLEGKSVRIRVWASGSPVDTTRVENVVDAIKWLNKMFIEYGINFKLDFEYQFFRTGYFDKFEVACAAGEAPDIIAMKDLAMLAEGGYVVPLDEYIEKYKYLVEDYVETLWNSVKYKGKIWALPQDTEARPLYFRKDVLRKLGWSEADIEALPEKIKKGEVTLLDLIKVAKEAMTKGYVEWGFYHRPNFGGTPFIILYYQYGGTLQDPETGKLVLNKTAMEKALGILYKMAVEEGVLPKDMIGTPWREIHVGFVNGKVLFWFGGTWHWAEWQAVPYHEKLGAVPEDWLWENIGFALVPAPEPGLKPLTLSSPYLYYVVNQTKCGKTEWYPELVFIVIALATSASLDARHAVDSGHLPVRTTTLEHPYYKQSKFLQEVSYMLEYTSYEPIHPRWGDYKSIWLEAITKVEKGEMTPKAAVDYMESALKEKLGDQIIIVS